MPNSFHGNWIWQLHHNGFGLITISIFILLITFLAILNYVDGVHISSHQSNAPYIYIYILYIYLLVKGKEYPSNSPHFMRWKLAHPWWGSNPRSLTSSINHHVSDHQNKANIFLYMRVSTQRHFIRKWQKIWIEYVRWRPFWIVRFVGKWCHLQLGIRQNWIQHNIFM